MTDKEIISCAENCCNTIPNCNNCPFDINAITVDECMGKLLEASLDLAKRQKTEIDILIRKKETLRDEIAELQAENERLRNTVKTDFLTATEKLKLSQSDIVEMRAEATKEFAERLKFELETTFDEPIFNTIVGKIIKSTIDKVLKELTEPIKIEHNSLCETETYESR